jgi:hypothetical protein
VLDDPRDQRFKHIALTERGQRAARAIRDIVREVERAALAPRARYGPRAGAQGETGAARRNRLSPGSLRDPPLTAPPDDEQ